MKERTPDTFVHPKKSGRRKSSSLEFTYQKKKSLPSLELSLEEGSLQVLNRPFGSFKDPSIPLSPNTLHQRSIKTTSIEQIRQRIER